MKERDENEFLLVTGVTRGDNHSCQKLQQRNKNTMLATSYSRCRSNVGK